MKVNTKVDFRYLGRGTKLGLSRGVEKRVEIISNNGEGGRRCRSHDPVSRLLARPCLTTAGTAASTTLSDDCWYDPVSRLMARPCLMTDGTTLSHDRWNDFIS
ncbi:hypothetical protein NDU88_002857 [Pleurodeles waltl]|uniref:Uncharacterized protein n=1 Tax=Pleurodeles waltl TaxID=8319 RepID=A0AAV7UZQ5_PLEWA|nr:hypothetical protein NDU88_002857 [Pleurodeles waltl]